MTRTPGPWALRGYQIRADDGRGAHVATYQISEEDGALIGAAPELLEMFEHVCALLSATGTHADVATVRRHQDRLTALGVGPA
jgi:hypothetical protein